MSLQVEQLEHNMAKLTIEVSAEELEGALQKAYQKQKSRINVPGFRKGKVPRQLIEKMYGPEIFYDDAANALIPEAYSKAYDESGLEIVSQPKIDVTQIEKGKPFIFTAEVATKPEVELGEYKGIEVPKYSNRVTQKEIDAKLEEEQLKNARTITVEGRPVQDKDEVVLDFEGFVDGEAFEGGKGENYSLTIGSNTFIPGFEDQIIGMSKDEEKDINVTFPEDYHSEDLKGQKVVFKVKVNEIKTTKIPELDKDFFEDLAMEGIDSKESLEKQLEENIKAHKEQHAEDHYIDELLKKGIENMEVDIPEAMINEELDRMIRQYEENLKMQGLTLQQFYQFTNSDETALKDQMKEEAEKRVASRLLLEAIKVEEKIEIADDEAKKEAEELAKKYNMEKDEFLKLFGGIEMVKYDMEMRRAIEILKENN